MAGATEFLATINSVVRTLIALAVMGGLGVLGWFGYSKFNAGELEARKSQQELAAKTEEVERQRAVIERSERQLTEMNQQLADKEEVIAGQTAEISKLNAQVEAKQKEIDKLDAAMRLLKVDHRLAQITVLEQGDDPKTGREYTTVEFRELTDDGGWIGQPRVFRLNGDTVYVDCWIVKFDDKYVEQADLHRSTSLCLFRSVYGNIDGPEGAHPLEDVGSRPLAYSRGGKLTDFEKKIWDDFWSIANDPEKAQQLGIRAAHGQANFTKVRKGKIYRLQLRASDGLTTLPALDAPPAGGNKAA
jgi:uncharacterized coiled-coil protein SlyX